MDTIALKSPAKLNLYLKVINKRKDGYHNIVTIFERINLCDTLYLKKNKSGTIKIFCSHPDVPRNENNIAYKAAYILKQASRTNFGVDITIKKRIPVAAGLGGGSSNAAFTLIGLNRLWGLDLSRREFFDYSKKIGADVPFFVTEKQFALGSARGDRLKILSQAKKKLWHILVVPSFKIATREIYERLNLGLRNSQQRKLLTKVKDNVTIFIHALRDNNLSLLNRLVFNDLWEAVSSSFPKLFKIKQSLNNLGIKGLCLSGSGPSLFGLVGSRKEAESLKASLKLKGCQIFSVKTF